LTAGSFQSIIVPSTEGKIMKTRTAHDTAWDTLSDLHKDVYGFRPRGVYDFDSMSTDDIEDEIERLIPALNEVVAAEQARERAAIVAFEQVITETIANGAGTRANAINWLRDAEEDDFMTDGYFGFLYGLPHNYFEKAA